MIKNNPFAYEFDDSRSFKTFAQTRNAKYTKTATEVYQATAKEAFVDNAVAPDVNIAYVDGYDAAEDSESATVATESVGEEEYYTEEEVGEKTEESNETESIKSEETTETKVDENETELDVAE